ncbi:DinB family protein [Pontibacter rugosus]|uniref:DinB family protein n=2 Tax=Pontibacter rugosus TaxID=1745966 RepID=A0ABW3SVX0_9BACT
MDAKLESKYLRLEQTRNLLLDELESLDDAQLNSMPAAGKWSLNQHVAHLVIVDDAALGGIRYKLQQQDKLRDSTFAQAVKAFLLKVALKSGKKYKAPAAVATVPDTAHLPALRQNWDKVRFQLEDELTSMPHHLLDKGIFKHPRVGYLNINQTLSFLQDHFDHHVQIMQRIKSELIN